MHLSAFDKDPWHVNTDLKLKGLLATKRPMEKTGFNEIR
jgi:hypothetical protein